MKKEINIEGHIVILESGKIYIVPDDEWEEYVNHDGDDDGPPCFMFDTIQGLSQTLMKYNNNICNALDILEDTDYYPKYTGGNE